MHGQKNIRVEKSKFYFTTQSALNQHIVRPFTESDDTRCCNYTICPPEDEHNAARNMWRIIT